MISSLRKAPVVEAKLIASGKKIREQILFCSTKHLSKIETIQKNRGFLLNKVDDFVQWYDEFTGMSEVRRAQDKVLEEEENFKKAQTSRRTILLELSEIQRKIKEIYAELDTTKRGEDKYIYLVTVENKLLKEEKSLLDKFSLAEKDERDCFTALSNSVKLSHERERAQAERTRYWSVFGSILGTIIGIVGTSINNHFKMKDLKTIVQKSDIKLIESLKNLLEEKSNVLDELKNHEKNYSHTINENKIENLFNKINLKLSDVEDKLKIIEQNNNSNNSFQNVVSQGEATVMPVGMNTYVKTVLCAFLALSVAMPIISRMF